MQAPARALAAAGARMFSNRLVPSSIARVLPLLKALLYRWYL